MKGTALAITRQYIENLCFGTAKNGYEPEEVDRALDEIADEIDALHLALNKAAEIIEALEG